MGPFQVTYTTTLNDLVAYIRHFNNRSWVAWAVYIPGWLGPALFAVWVAVENYRAGWRREAAITAAVGVLYAAAYPWVFRFIHDWAVWLQAKQMGTRGTVGRITLILTEETLVEITETIRLEVRWENIQRVDARADYTFIFVSGVSAITMPRRGFDSDDEYEEAREFVLARAARMPA